MKEISCISALNEINSKDPVFHKLYLIYGEGNRYLKNQIVERLKDRILDKTTEAFDFSVFDGGSTKTKDIENAIISPPFGNKKIIYLDNAQEMPIKEIRSILSIRIPDFSIFIVNSNSKNVPIVMEEDCIAVTDYTISQPVMEEWVKIKFKEFGKEISKEAVAEILDRLDEEFYVLESEIRKVSLYIGPRNKVEVKDIKEVVQDVPETDVFELVRAIIMGKREQAMQLYYSIQSGKTFQENIFFSVLLREFSKTILIKDFIDKGIKDSGVIIDLMKQIFGTELKKGYVRKIASESERISFEEFAEKFRGLVEIDVKSKKGEADLPVKIEQFIQNL